MSQNFALFGNPVSHSKSPYLHQNFAQQFDLAIDYRKLLSTPENFKADVRDFFSTGGDGCNVTVPFKEDAFALCDILSPMAARARAVNTLYLNAEKKLCGHNTDGIGLVNDLLNNHKTDIANRHVLIIGAGGATRGILGPVIAHNPASVTVANRTYAKAQQLAAEFADLFQVHTCSTSTIDTPDKPDIIINATSASLSAELPVTDALLITDCTVCYDLAYANEPTAFMQWASSHGCAKSLDGKGMLIEQAAAAFTTWTKLTPTTAPLILEFASA
ncbi:shikimate dehydrogenase [Chromatiales bacterium (ex Bugula neritina AB1)]|nr:shikimate dehydrogenase [Chromatiales bacterium (ex Bugula neritina AB1)]